MHFAKHTNVQKFTLKKNVAQNESATVCEFLVTHTGLSKGRIKDAMNKGAVWLKRNRSGEERVRRTTTAVRPGDRLSLYYDQRLLALRPAEPECIHDLKRYSVWFKPAGLMTQGTRYGDHCSLLRRADLFFKPRRRVFPVHRLDREASGIVLIAHDKTAAGRLSRLFQTRRIVKRYCAQVRGNPAEKKPGGAIDIPLEGKTALTEFAVRNYDPASDTSTVMVTIRTGRKHQIRRHFELIGCPVMGDPRYGKDNKNATGLKLTATALVFRCPFAGKEYVFETSRPIN